ncbi:Methyltransferase domain-containing protein [Nocardioides alpinus]|nr:class I SAM-dependent methyltransferase [Nocardioides alpinus]SFB22353.1 Methyltransferase domain-containing protein [Nocardioides alpinus]
MSDQSFSEVFASALHGSPTVVVGLAEQPLALPTDLWTRPADVVDRAMVGLCVGPTIDIGCGPGRMTEALGTAGHIALGIDVVDAAVALTRRRGGSAVRRDVFDRVPGEGRWHTALLADGNIGIGGDPVALLRRVRRLLAPGGRVVVEVAPPGTGAVRAWAVLESAESRSRPFRWATLGVDDLAATAAAAGFSSPAVHRLGDRFAAVLGEGSW